MDNPVHANTIKWRHLVDNPRQFPKISINFAIRVTEFCQKKHANVLLSVFLTARLGNIVYLVFFQLTGLNY